MDFEAVQAVLGQRCIGVRVKLDKRDVLSIRDESNLCLSVPWASPHTSYLLETGILVEQHVHHDICRFGGEVGDKEDTIGDF
jgi:hypothetical protein